MTKIYYIRTNGYDMVVTDDGIFRRCFVNPFADRVFSIEEVVDDFYKNILSDVEDDENGELSLMPIELFTDVPENTVLAEIEKDFGVKSVCESDVIDCLYDIAPQNFARFDFVSLDEYMVKMGFESMIDADFDKVSNDGQICYSIEIGEEKFDICLEFNICSKGPYGQGAFHNVITITDASII